METSDINKELLLAAQSGHLDKLKKAISQGEKVVHIVFLRVVLYYL